MKNFIQQNGLFLFGTLLFSGLALVYSYAVTDAVEQFRFISEHRTPWQDEFFGQFTKMAEEYVFIAATIFMLFVRFRYAITVPLIGLLGMGLSDVLKSYFSHPRPYWVLFQSQRLEELQFATGFPPLQSHTDSFPSGHTLTGFAFYAFLSFVARLQGWKAVCLCCAVGVAVSRVWLVHHFPKDVGVGALYGLFLALLVWWVHDQINPDPTKWWNRRLRLGQAA